VELKGDANWRETIFPENFDCRCPLELQASVSWYKGNFHGISSSQYLKFSGKVFWKHGARGPEINGSVNLSDLSISEYENNMEIRSEIENNALLTVQGIATWNWEEWPPNRRGTFYWQWSGKASKRPSGPYWSLEGITTKGWGQWPPLMTETSWKP
jgi:hypothetical protein